MHGENSAQAGGRARHALVFHTGLHGSPKEARQAHTQPMAGCRKLKPKTHIGYTAKNKRGDARTHTQRNCTTLHSEQNIGTKTH